jgi:hypothetical protein
VLKWYRAQGMHSTCNARVSICVSALEAQAHAYCAHLSAHGALNIVYNTDGLATHEKSLIERLLCQPLLPMSITMQLAYYATLQGH